jgi:hypothetical protein
MEKTLNTSEKFLILAHHPGKGRLVVSRQYFRYGLAGAILLDLCLDGRIWMENGRITPKPGNTPADPVKREVIQMITESTRPRRTGYWIRKLAFRYNGYLNQIRTGLAGKKLLRIEETRLLGIIPWRRSWLTESYTRINLIRQLKNDILVYRGEAGESSALAGLVEACRMRRILSTDREELKMIRSQIKRILKDSPVSDAVAQTIRQIQAAIIASVTASVAASSGSH